MKKVPQIVVHNNAGYAIPVQLFGTAAGGAAGSANALTTYKFDITAQVYLQTNLLTIQAKASAAAPFITYQVIGNFQSANDVAAALNTLNIGQFSVDNSLGSIFINVSNDIITYGNLVIGSTFGFTIQWQINFIVPVIPPYEFHVKDLTAGGATVFQSANNIQSGSAFISAPDAVIGDDYLFEAGWTNLYTTTSTLFRNGVQVQQIIVTDFFGGCDNILPAYGVVYNIVINVTA